MNRTLIRNATVINEGRIEALDILISGHFIERISISGSIIPPDGTEIIDASGLHLFPGAIDDQVHFREPGLTHKGDIYSEAKAAVAGGITSYMEMPNTLPGAVSLDVLERKYEIASDVSLANYSFYLGATNSNLEELLRADPKVICGVKIFMGSSTGDLLVNDTTALEDIFREVRMLIATHCEDNAIIKRNETIYREKFGDHIPMKYHPLIRSAEACYSSSSRAVTLAEKYGSRLHILHISTAKELGLFRHDIPLKEKKITAEACIHHLWFSDEDYETKGTFIKWNPAVKTAQDRTALWQALNDGRIDVVATDHAPHTLEEKRESYFKAPSGGPMVQHALVAMLELVRRGVFPLTLVPQKMAHNVADLFAIDRRGFIREGYFADLVLVNMNKPFEVEKSNLLYKCRWSPFEETMFQSSVVTTFVNGHPVFNNGVFDESQRGKRLTFIR